MSNKNAFLAKFQSQNHQSSQDEYNQKKNEILSLNYTLALLYAYSLGSIYLLKKDCLINMEHNSAFYILSPLITQDDLSTKHEELGRYEKEVNQDRLFLLSLTIAFNRFNYLESDIKEYISEVADNLNETIDRTDYYSSAYNILEKYSNLIKNDNNHTIIEDNALLVGVSLWQLATKGIYEEDLPNIMMAMTTKIEEPIDRKTRELINDILENMFDFILDKINNTLGMNIELTFIEFLSDLEKEEFQGFVELWQEAIKNERFAVFSVEHELFPILTEEDIPLNTTTYEEPQPDSKASAAILKFFDSNSNALIAKLKDSGLQLSASALQNDQNITRVANVVYNLLPGMVRIFVSFDTVENFLLEHRQWLINKLI